MTTGPAPAGAANQTAPTPDVWDHQSRISRQLAAWGIVSLTAGAAVGLVGQLRSSAPVRAFGTQNAAWGAVDLAIAGFGQQRSRARRAQASDPTDALLQDGELRALRRVLLVNAGLDVAYIAAGLGTMGWALRRNRQPLPAVVGHAAAVILQGGFLLAFDTNHARGCKTG